ncbi:MAG: co-chaperone DjlA [Halioglobus sp.]
MVLGKIIAGLIGLVTGGFPGLIVGGVLGHLFDRALARQFGLGSAESLHAVRESFFETAFLLSGYLAKIDGRVSEKEVAHTEQVFVQMGLDAAQRQRAISLFKQGSAAGFMPEPAVAGFVQTCGNRNQLKRTLLLFLISLAQADEQLQPSEHDALRRITRLLGLNVLQLDLLLQMTRGQQHFHSRAGGARQPAKASLEDAYAALGVASSVNDRELKRAYRKRMSENHPDKLIARGVPEDMVKLATERSQDVQAAYEMIRQHRGIKK